jgi:SAM-dependent methyltransferase
MEERASAPARKPSVAAIIESSHNESSLEEGRPLCRESTSVWVCTVANLRDAGSDRFIWLSRTTKAVARPSGLQFAGQYTAPVCVTSGATLPHPDAYSEQYYQENGQDSDRAALWFYERVVRRMVPAGSRVLDYGCGSGFFVRRLSRHFSASGFDLSPTARQLTESHASGVTVYERPDDVPSRSFDLVTALHVLEHIQEPSEALTWFSEWLAPDGFLFAVVPNPDGWGHKLKGTDWFAYRDPTHCSLLSMEEWLIKVRTAGFDLSRVGTDGLWDAPYVRRVPRIVQLPVFGAMAAAQVALGRVFLPPTWGECLVLAGRHR